MAIIKPNNNTISAITALPAGVGGKVLQVVHGSHQSQASTTSTSFVDLSSNTNVTITPSATSSNIMVLAQFHEIFHDNPGSSTLYVPIRVTRAGTEIHKAFTLYTQSLGGEEMSNQELTGVDEPNTTSAIEYKLQFHSSSGQTVRVNQNSLARGSTITLLEIGA